MSYIWIILKFLFCIPVFLFGLFLFIPTLALWFVSRVMFGTSIFLALSGLAGIAKFAGADRKQLDEIYKAYSDIMEQV